MAELNMLITGPLNEMVRVRFPKEDASIIEADGYPLDRWVADRLLRVQQHLPQVRIRGDGVRADFTLEELKEMGGAEYAARVWDDWVVELFKGESLIFQDYADSLLFDHIYAMASA